jgi:hypothetical protein
MRNRRRNKFPFHRAPQARSAEARASTEPIQQGETAAPAVEARQSSQTGRGASEIFDMVCDRARKGDLAAAKIVLETSEVPVAFPLPDIKTTNDVIKATPYVLRALAAGNLTPSQAGTILKLLDHSAQLLKKASDEPSSLQPPKVNIAFGRPDGLHMGEFYAEQDRLRYQQKCESTPLENVEGGSISGATGLGNAVEMERQSRRSLFVGESDEISPAAEKVEATQERVDQDWEAVEREKQSPRSLFVGESDEISLAAEKVKAKREEDDPWEGFIGER